MGGLFWQGGTNFGCLNQSGETDFGCQNWSGGPLFRKNRSGGTDLEYFDCSNFHWQGTTKFGWAWPAPVMAVEPLSAVQPGHAFKTALRKPIAYRSLSRCPPALNDLFIHVYFGNTELPRSCCSRAKCTSRLGLFNYPCQVPCNPRLAPAELTTFKTALKPISYTDLLIHRYISFILALITSHTTAIAD